jgi:hypothetical protein
MHLKPVNPPGPDARDIRIRVRIYNVLNIDHATPFDGAGMYMRIPIRLTDQANCISSPCTVEDIDVDVQLTCDNGDCEAGYASYVGIDTVLGVDLIRSGYTQAVEYGQIQVFDPSGGLYLIQGQVVP